MKPTLRTLAGPGITAWHIAVRERGHWRACCRTDLVFATTRLTAAENVPSKRRCLAAACRQRWPELVKMSTAPAGQTAK